ncbi:MAG TPA: HAD-IIB family hydrolase [Erysipelotrichaceae bacterium]|nr:HAD-IIB family hydrolase [Erysipelotrichaceae bacterium]
MKNSDIFYFDVDGTILDSETQKISEDTIKAIDSLQAAGYKIAIATGRTSASLDNPEIRSVCDWDGYVLANGGSILDKDFNVVKEHLCESEFIEKIIELYPGTILLEGYKNYVINDMSDRMREFLGEVADVVIPIEKYQGEKILNIIIEDVSLIPNGYDNEVFKNYDYFINTGDMPEFFPKGSGKHVAIAELNEIMDYKRHTFFGDGNNDIDPIREADFGVAMENASDGAKAVANYVTKSVGEDGVRHALEFFEVI